MDAAMTGAHREMHRTVYIQPDVNAAYWMNNHAPALPQLRGLFGRRHTTPILTLSDFLPEGVGRAGCRCKG